MNSNNESALNEAIEAAISDRNCGDGCVIDIRETGKISLSRALNKIGDLNHPIWLLGNNSSKTTIDAGSYDQHLFVDNSKDGFFALQTVELNNGYVKGGDAAVGAGGGLGAGGAMFVNNGLVILEHIAVTDNIAKEGLSSGRAGKGGNGDDNGQSHPGNAGSDGARMNSGATYVPSDSGGGGKGRGGDVCDHHGANRCPAQEKQHGGSGEFGHGAGSAGGGGGDHGGTPDSARHGGNGGKGGFGAGGGGGGGGGQDDWEFASKPEHGRGGGGGLGGKFAGEKGSGGSNGSDSGGGSGGSGGDGAGLGGGIFVRGDNGAELIVNNASFSGNRAANSGNAIFVWDGSIGTDQDNNTINNNSPTLSLSVVDLYGADQTRFVEGERANLVITIDGSLPNQGGAKVPVYLYLSDLDGLAEKGSGNIETDKGADFAWNGSNLIKLMLPAGQVGKYYVSLPDASATNELGVYSGIQLYLDKVLEGDESFTVSLLAGPDYQLANDNISQTIIIEDANYQVELLQDAAMNHTAICDAADALEQRAQAPEMDCKSGGRASRIDVDDLKGLGYVTVQAKRPVNFFRDGKTSALPEDWATNVNKYTSFITGELFNNALAGGLTVHYSIVDKPSDVLSNQVNYNNERYEGIAGELPGEKGAQVFNAVVIPVTSVESKEEQALPPGSARIYFSALPDAVKDATQTFALSLEAFPEDPSYDQDNFCNDDNQSVCKVLFNTPAGNYQFYTVTDDNTANNVKLAVHDSGEFTAEIVIIDAINGEPVTDDNDLHNPLLIDESGGLAFWVKLGSQPTANVVVTINNQELAFGAKTWHLYQAVSIADGNWEHSISVAVSSSDSEYSEELNRTLTPSDNPTRFKIKEAAIPQVSARQVQVGVQATMEDYREGFLDYPLFNVVLSQPLPVAVVANVTSVINSNTKTYKVAIPAWQQVAQVAIPVADDSLVNGDRVLSVTVNSVVDQNDAVLSNIQVSSMHTAKMQVQDDEQARILISQHLPDSASKGDMVRLLPEVEILGITPSGNLQVQQNDSRIKNIVITQVKDGLNNEGGNITQHGLLYELVANNPGSTGQTLESAPSENFKYIVLPEQPYKAQINDSDDPLTLATIPSNHIVRQRGSITVDQTGWYIFSYQKQGNQRVELWMNTIDDYSQNKGLILPYFKDTDHNGIPDEKPVAESASIELKANTRYYLEALYEAPSIGPFQIVQMNYSYSVSDPNQTRQAGVTRNTATPIPVEWLSPATVDGGFVVEVYENIDTESLDVFMQSEAFTQGVPSRMDILTDKLEIPAIDWSSKIGRRITVNITAPESGEYQFALASDGDAKMYLLDADGKREEISWIKGVEKYGRYNIETQKNNYVGSPMTRAKFTLERFGDNIYADTEWEIEYTMADTSKGTLPRGNHNTVSIFKGMIDTDHICQDDNLTYSSGGVTWQGEGSAVMENSLTFSNPGDCDPFFDGYDGKSLTLIFQDFPDYYAPKDYTNIILDGQQLDKDPDYPGIRDWYWDDVAEGDGTAGQQASQQRSALLTFTQGKEYTLEIVQINSRDDDHLSVAWKRPSAETLEVIDAANISFTRLTLPVTLLEASGAGVETSSNEIELRLSASPFLYKGGEYQVSSVTLAGDPEGQAEGVTPHQAPGWLEFTSGFSASLVTDSILTVDSTSKVAITLQDRPTDPAVVSLSVGQTQRIGFQLAGKPANNANIVIDVTIEYPKTKAGNTAELGLKCQAGEGDNCQQFTFTSDNWSIPQYINVTAIAAGPVANVDYDPSLSKATVTATQRSESETVDQFNTDTITIQIYPNTTQNDTVYFAKARGEAIKSIGFTNKTLESIKIHDAQGNDLGWFWRLENGKLLGSKIEDGDYSIIISAMSDEEAAGLNITSVPVDIDPVTFTAAVELNEQYYTDIGDIRDVVTVSGIQWVINTDQQGALGTLVINAGQPGLTLASQLVSTSVENFADLEYFSYQPQGREPVRAAPNEVLVTEFGEITLVNKEGGIRWRFEPNPRPQPQGLSFSLHLSTNVNIPQTIDLSDYNKAPALATSMSALPDFTKPRVVLSGFTVVQENAGEQKLTVTLKSADGREIINASENINVYYTVAQLGVTDPGNKALDLAPQPKSNDAFLQSARALQLAKPIVLQEQNNDLFTLEAWIYPTENNSKQGIFAGTATDGETIDLLFLSNGELQTFGGLSAALPSKLAAGIGFHIAWRVGDLGQALFVNGEKIKQKDTLFHDKAPLTLTDIGKGKTDYLNGLIDEVRVWGEARSDLEIAQNYYTSLVSLTDRDNAGLLGYWGFNDFTLQKTENELLLLNKDGEIIDTSLQANQQALWKIQRSATVNLDYEGLSSHASKMQNIFDLTPEMTDGQSTFAIGDLNNDQRNDVAIVNRRGELSFMLSTPASKGAREVKAEHYQRITTDINLGYAAPLALGDIDGDKDLDLVAGLSSGKVALLRNISNAANIRAAGGLADSAVQFAGLQSVEVQYLARGGNQEDPQIFAPAFVPTSSGKPRLLLTAKNQILSFDVHADNQQWQLRQRERDSSSFAQLSLSKRLQQRNITPQYVDLDRDGDHDLILDTLRNLPGQTPGALTYYENFGSDAAPVYFPAPRSHIARFLKQAARYLAPEYRRVNIKYHPFDQVAYAQLADMDNDGFDDILVSDNAGEIHLFTSQGYDFVTIPKGSSSADIRVTVLDDAYVETSESIVVQLVEGKPEQAQYHYADGEDRAIIKIEDNDQPGLVLLDANDAEVTAAVRVSEIGDATAYKVKLRSQPTREVSIRVASSNPINGGLLALGSDLKTAPADSGFTDTIFMQFTANKNDWQEPKIFWIKGIDDQVDDPDEAFVIAVVASSGDITYDKQAAVLPAISSDNDDQAVVNLQFASLPNVDAMGVVVSSEGQVNALTVSLAAQPRAPVALTLQPTDKELTLFPQRKLVRALTTNDDSQQIRRIYSRSIHREANILDCTLPSGAAGISTKGDYGNWCWHESGEYEFQQMRYAERNKPLEQLSFMVDNSYGKLSTETISARLSAADVSSKSPAIEVIDLLTGEIIGNSASAVQELLHKNKLAQDPVVSFGVRPSTKISGDDRITITSIGTSIEHQLNFTAQDWQQWQRIDDESLSTGNTVSLSAMFTRESVRSVYGEPRDLTVVDSPAQRLVLQDWRMALTKGGVQLADNDDVAVFADEAGKVILNVRLSAAPADSVDVGVVGDSSMTVSFTKDNYLQWQKLLVNADGLDSIQVQSKEHNNSDYAATRSLTVVKQAMGKSLGNFFEHAGNLAGDSLTLYFTPDDWQLGQTFTVSAIDDQKVEYTSISTIDMLLANPEQALSGDMGQLRWDLGGALSYTLRPDLNEGFYVEQRFYFTDDDDAYDNHTLDITVRMTETSDQGESNFSYEVLGYVDAPTCVRVNQSCADMPTSINFTQVGNSFEANLDLINANLTGVAQQPLAAAFLARLQDPITVSIEDNDKPVVRAGVDLNASENTHPGYFTLSVLDPVGIPGGLGVHYRVIGVEEGAAFGATAETVPPSGGGLNDPGPDFQAYDVIKQGTLFIPQDKTRVSLPIFPIDDFTPEESLAARYEKVVLIIEPPVGNGDYDGDQYLLDEGNPQYKTAGVRIMDNEEVGLKYVLPMQGLTVDEGNFNGFKVGLMSQPQTQVSLDFYNTSVRHKNAFDGSFFNVSSVTFDNTNWNQWQTIDVQLYNNQMENYDSKSPRFSDLYFTLLDSSSGCANNPTDLSKCEPFYNSMKGALNMTSPDNENDGEAKVVEISDVTMTHQESDFGTLTPLKGTDNIFSGDFVYVLSNGDYGSADNSQDMLKAINQSASGEIYDVFDYTMKPLQGSVISQQVAVQIKALERIEFADVTDQTSINFPAGKFGNLTFTFDGSHGTYTYTYMFNTDTIESALQYSEEWRVTDSFVFEMSSGVAGGELQQEFVAFNIEVNKYQQDHNGTDKTYYQALINGNPPAVCKGSAEQTVCEVSGPKRFISGNVTPNTIGGSVADSSVKYKIIKAGRPVLEPVVTRVNLRDSEGVDLWAGNQLVHTNPLFDANNINGTDSLVKVGEKLEGNYGELTLTADGSFQYLVDFNLLNNGLDPTDMRQVNDTFVVQFSNHARVAMTFVSTLQVDQNAEKLVVTMNDELLASDANNAVQFSGVLLSAEDELHVVRVGRLPHTVRLREQGLPPQVLAQGLAEALNFIQQRFYDTSVPVFGRMGGGPTSDTTGNSEEAKVPSFIDRMLPLLIAKITAQPHLTTEGLANVINAVLQSTFAQYNVPLQVLKFDSEKLIMRLSYTAGISIATNELKTDLGMPSMGHFSGSAAGTAKFTADLVFGINFRSVQSGDDGNKMTPSVFVVTEQETLNALLGAPQMEPVNIYELKTWESTSVGNSGVSFVTRDGSLFDKQALAIEPGNIKAINTGLKDSYCDVYTICPELRWKWLEENQSMNWDLNGWKKGSHGGVKDFGTLVGYVTNPTVEGNRVIEYGDVIAISLRQPDSIGPNKVTQIQLGVTIDPGNVLASNRQSDSLKKEYIRGVLEYLSSTNTKLTYANEYIRVFDIYSQNYGPNDKSMTAHSSQTLNLGFSVGVQREGSSDPLGYFHPDSYVAKAKVNKAEPVDKVTVGDIIVPVNSTYSDKTKSVTTECRSSTSSSSWKCNISSRLEVKATWQQGGSASKRYFPSDSNAFKTKTIYKETLAVANGKLKIIGKVQGKDGSKTVKWTWKFSSLPAKSQNFPPNSSLIDVPVIEIAAEDAVSSKVVADYTITRHMLMFVEDQPGDDSKKANALSKLTGELAASIEFRGDMQFFLLGGSINQARRIPTDVDATSIIAPDEVFGRLTGAMNAKSTIVNVEESNTADVPAYVVGQYGVLAIAKDGSYSYYRKPELELESWVLSCGNYEQTPVDPADASLKAFCKDLLAVDEEGNALYWDNETQAQNDILIKGYHVESCGSYTEVAAGTADCEVQNPNVIYVPEDAKVLTEDGVSSLESAINVELVDLTGWQDTANLVNRKTLKQVWELIKTSDPGGIMYGQTQLVDDFFISVTSDTAFRKLSFELGNDGVIQATFENVPFNGLMSDTISYPADGKLDAKGWTGGRINYHEFGFGEVLQASSLAIQPMAEANIYLSVALRDPRNGTETGKLQGLVYLTDFANPKDLVSYSLAGNAALYAKINAGIDANLYKETDDDENYQGFSIPGPSVSTNIGLVSNYQFEGSFSDVSSHGGEFMFGAFNLELDIGEFISDKLVEPLGAMSNFLDPVQPIANALTADMKIFQSLNLTHVFDANYDGKVTILEVPTPFLRSGGPKAERFQKQLKSVNRFLEFIGSMVQMIKIAGDLGDELSGVQALDERVISLDGYQLSPEVIRIVPYQTSSDFTNINLSLVPYVNQLGHIVLGIDKNYQYIKTFGGTLTPSTVKPMEPVKPPPGKPSTQKNTSMSKVKSRYADLQQRGVISFPILSNPMDVLKFVFGDPADLMLIDIPDLHFGFEVEKGWRPPPMPIFKGKISGKMQIVSDTMVGIDTAGLLSAVCGSDAPGVVWDCQGELSAGDRSIRLLNSVFLRDWNEQSYYAGGDTSANKVFWKGAERQLPGITVWDKYELAGNAEVDIGAGIDLGVFGAFFQGGPGIGGGIDVVDLCEPSTPDSCDPIQNQNGDFTAGGVYDGKIRAYDFVMQMINDPISTFDIGFTFYVDFEAYIETFKVKVWEELIGYFPLFEFDKDGAHWAGGAKSGSGVALAGAILYFDANNNLQLDPGEPMTFTDAKGLANLDIPYHLYDRNRDGRISNQDGTIRHFGGMNIKTGLGEVQRVN
ncbi:LamG domain-containing protein [Moritella sp. JT01]|uniref:LamG domain-containing protein n=1 Tax=Moritella sp. JT01 TaxID=756698 RepID=UPI0012F94ED9|nr:LamG domain-containing protein [Moritella sp. JT01]